MNNIENTIDNDFVTYKQALALKKLGFINPCFGAFIGEEFKFFNFSNDIKGYANDKNLIIGAPTYFQAFKWFRRKYELRYKFEPSREDTVDVFIWLIVGWNFFKNIKEEEAESACLDKLIEIVKNEK